LMQGLFPDDSSDGSDIVLRLDLKRGMAVVEVELRILRKMGTGGTYIPMRGAHAGS